jgi:hypothetical protein
LHFASDLRPLRRVSQNLNVFRRDVQIDLPARFEARNSTGGEQMKPLPLLVVTLAVSACATQPMPPSAQPVGESQQPVPAVSQCIAQKWANQSQQQVISQVIVANNQAMDVYVPGQQPPNGAAAVVRPSWSGNSKTWVGFRGAGVSGGNTGGDVGGCL